MMNPKRGGSKTAAEALASHFDLMTEILLCVPAKPLLEFKRVSRQWYNLISTTQFRIKHTRRRSLNTRPAGVFLRRIRIPEAMRYLGLHEDYRVRNHSMDFLKFPKGLLLIDSCNGLLLCTSEQDMCRWDQESKLYVCNPITKRVVKIPGLLESDSDGFFDKLILYFDPSTPEKYIVICLWNFLEDGHGYIIDVYESETGLWRHSATISEDVCESEILGGVFWNGAVHWVDAKGYALYCFDLSLECFRRTMLLPKSSSTGGFTDIEIKACQGHFYVLNVDGLVGPVMLTIYEMEPDFSCLSVKYSISHDSFTWTEFYGYPVRVLGIFLGEEGQMFIVLRTGLEVYTYNANVSNSVHSKTVLSGNHHNNYWDFYSYMYTESLAPI